MEYNVLQNCSRCNNGHWFLFLQQKVTLTSGWKLKRRNSPAERRWRGATSPTTCPRPACPLKLSTATSPSCCLQEWTQWERVLQLLLYYMSYIRSLNISTLPFQISSTLSWSLYELSRHPEVQASLRSEVLAVLQGRRVAEAADVAHMPLLKAVVKEVLRYTSRAHCYWVKKTFLFVFFCRTKEWFDFSGCILSFLQMPGWIRRKKSQWEVTSFQKMWVNGRGPYVVHKLNITILPFSITHIYLWTLPIQTLITLCHFATSRDPAVFTNPDEFQPHRWLNKDQTHHPYASVPFGVGKRSCIGRRIAELELYLAIARVSWLVSLITDI